MGNFYFDSSSLHSSSQLIQDIFISQSDCTDLQAQIGSCVISDLDLPQVYFQDMVNDELRKPSACFIIITKSLLNIKLYMSAICFLLKSEMPNFLIEKWPIQSF